MLSSLVEGDNREQNDESPFASPKTPGRLKAKLLERWNSGGSNGSSKSNIVSPFWNCSYVMDSSSSFTRTDPSQRLVNTSSIKKQNQISTRDYKEKNLKERKGPERVPSRGMSIRTKPPTLEDIISVDEQKNSKLSRSTHSSSSFDKNASDMKIIRKAVENNLFFDQMDSNDLSEFVDACENIEVARGLKIVTQGDTGDFFYIIGKDSSVAFELNGVRVGEGGDGGSFGELALIYSCPRAATVIAMSSPTNLFRVERNTFKSLLRSQIKSKEAQKICLLEAIDFLSEMSEFDRITLGRAMTLRVFECDDVIVKKGDEGDAFYIVNKGQLKVTNTSVGGPKYNDITLKSGDYFGERALATSEPRAANVIAITKGYAFRINRKTFEKVLGEFSRVIMKALDRKLMEGLEIFESSHLTKQQFEELANLVVDKKFLRNEMICTNGQSTNAALYLVREGSVKLTGERSDLIKPGAYFGENRLLLDTRSSEDTGKGAPTKTLARYSAIAEEDCMCGVLSLSDCRTIFDTSKMTNVKPGNDMEELSEECRISSTTTQWLKKESTIGLNRAVQNNLKLEDFKKHEMLGEGQFGEVFLVSAYVSPECGNQLFALKTQKKNDSRRGDTVAAIVREIDLLSCMDHPYIVNLVHYYENPEEMHILMGVVYGGELFDVIHTENSDGTWSSGLPECDAKFYAMVIADTLDYIHRKQYVYRDLKPENVLIDEDGYPIICDFGFAKFVTDKTYTLCGTPNYLSPEIIMNSGHNASTDHWALGILIYEMVAGENPFYYDGISQMDLLRCICQEKLYPLPKTASDEVFQVVDGLLQKDPTLRLGSLAHRGKDIMAKEWFEGLDLDDLREKKHKAPYIPDNETMDRLIEEALCKSDSEPSFVPYVDSKRTTGRRESGHRSSMVGNFTS